MSMNFEMIPVIRFEDIDTKLGSEDFEFLRDVWEGEYRWLGTDDWDLAEKERELEEEIEMQKKLGSEYSTPRLISKLKNDIALIKRMRAEHFNDGVIIKMD